jgi:hypothetical protein
MWYDVERLEYDVSIRCANSSPHAKERRVQVEILLLGAHYDSVPGSPGANDNASGVAALLEIARMFLRASGYGRYGPITLRLMRTLVWKE